MKASRKRKDTAGQLTLAGVAEEVREIRAKLEEKPQMVSMTVPAGATVTVGIPPASLAPDAPMTPARLATGLLRAMEMPGAEFHAGMMLAIERGLSIVQFSKRTHGALYHQTNRTAKRRREAAAVSQA